MHALTADLHGDVHVISCRSGIRPCNDCRHCRRYDGCAIDDAMQAVYEYIKDCDNVVIASPIWFSSLSGPTLNLASRLQALFSARHFRNAPWPIRPKNGVLLLAGAEPGTEAMPAQTALTILKLLRVRRDGVQTVCSLDTDRVPAAEDAAAMQRCREAAALLNRACAQGV